MSRIHHKQLSNGMWLVAEPMDDVQSVSMTMLLPAGVVSEPDDRQGVAALLAEMICRGAGDLDARAHSDALDRLGVQRSTNVETHHLSVSASMIGSNLAEALPLLCDMVRRPRLEPATLDPSRDLALQALCALDDEPQQKVFLDLRRRHYPQPIGRSPLGVAAHLESIDGAAVQAFRERAFVPEGTLLGFAGRFDVAELEDLVERLLGDWQGAAPAPAPASDAPRGYHHEQAETSQVHIGLLYDAVPEPDDRSVLCRTAIAVLSGGMGSRLFTEVREKRGLCYAVYAGYVGQRDYGAVLSYAGTTTPTRAQDTLDVLRGEHERMREGVEDDEFDRAVIGMKSRLVMQGESTAARARAVVTDQFIYGRPRSLDEQTKEIDGVTEEALRRYAAEHPPGPMTIVTIGPKALRS